MIIPGMFDFHVHTAPDVVARKTTDLELAQRLKEAGFGGVVLKNHYFETVSRAAILQELYPELLIFGGIVLNNTAGGLNPEAVSKAADMGAKVVWMPTMDSGAYRRIKTNNNTATGIEILDSKGNLHPAINEILTIAKDRDLVFSTGHISAEESLALMHRGYELGLKKLVVTHADNCNTRHTVQQQQEAVGLGAMIEYSYFTIVHGHTSLEELVDQIRANGVENVVLDSDLGQPANPFPDEGLSQMLSALHDAGLSRDDLATMVVDNPRKLLGI